MFLNVIDVENFETKRSIEFQIQINHFDLDRFSCLHFSNRKKKKLKKYQQIQSEDSFEEHCSN